MKVLSLYDGMACGMLAMQKAGIIVSKYVAYEIDKYAIQTSSHNFPMIEHKGDVFGADFTQYEGFDFVIGGSPCTYWSIAQKNNRETEASGMGWELFSQYVRAIHEAKPKFFIYENNKSMSKAIRASIDEAFGFEAVCINSALVSAQNRQRLYWVGARNEDGTYSKVPVDQPEDLGILLKDVLDGGVAEPVRVPAYGIEGKSRPVTACYAYKGCGEGSLATEAFPDNPNKQVRDYVAEPVGVGYRNRREEDGKLYRRFETHNEEKSNALATVRTDSMVAEPIRVGTMPQLNGVMKDNQATRIYSIEGKAVTQSAQGGCWGAKTGLYAIPTDKPIYEVKDGTITIKDKQYPIKLVDGYYIIRKLTVTECMKLQTVPEWYEWPVSNSQAYKMLGNGWTCSVIAHLLQSIKEFAKE